MTTLLFVWAFDFVMALHTGTFLAGSPPTAWARTIEPVPAVNGGIALEPHGGAITWASDNPQLVQWCASLGSPRCQVVFP